jgi:hypothetical protein
VLASDYQRTRLPTPNPSTKHPLGKRVQKYNLFPKQQALFSEKFYDRTQNAEKQGEKN